MDVYLIILYDIIYCYHNHIHILPTWIIFCFPTANIEAVCFYHHNTKLMVFLCHNKSKKKIKIAFFKGKKRVPMLLRLFKVR